MVGLYIHVNRMRPVSKQEWTEGCQCSFTHQDNTFDNHDVPRAALAATGLIGPYTPVNPRMPSLVAISDAHDAVDDTSKLKSPREELLNNIGKSYFPKRIASEVLVLFIDRAKKSINVLICIYVPCRLLAQLDSML